MNILTIIEKVKKNLNNIFNDTGGTFVFNVDGHEITATFTEKRNDDLVPRLREILLGYPHIRHDTPSDGKIKEKNKETV